MQFAPALPSVPAQQIDDAPLRDHMQSGRAGSCGVVGVADSVHPQQHAMHHVVDPTRPHALSARNGLHDRHAVPQQSRIGGAVTGLGGRHPGRPPPAGLVVCIAAHHVRRLSPNHVIPVGAGSIRGTRSGVAGSIAPGVADKAGCTHGRSPQCRAVAGRRMPAKRVPLDEWGRLVMAALKKRSCIGLFAAAGVAVTDLLMFASCGSYDRKSRRWT